MNRATPIIVNQMIAGAFVGLIWLFIPSAAMAQDASSSAPPSDYVSRAEYEKLKAEHEALKQEMEALKTTVQQMANGSPPAVPTESQAPKTAETGEGESGKQVVPTPSAKAVTPSTEVEAVSTEASGPLATHSFSI